MPTKPELIAALAALGETQAPTTLQKRSLPWLEERLAARQAEAAEAAAPPEPRPAVSVTAGDTVRVTPASLPVRVLEVGSDLQRTIRLRLEGPLPIAVLEQRHQVLVGGAPLNAAEALAEAIDTDSVAGRPVLVPLGGPKAVAVARQALTGILPGVLQDDHLAVSAGHAAAVVRALADVRAHVNQYGQTWARLLTRQVTAAFPDAAPPAPAAAGRRKTKGQTAAERVAAVQAQMKAARAAKQAHASGSGLPVLDGLVRAVFG